MVHLTANKSDHCPIVNCSLDHPSRPKFFRFFKAWTKDPTCGMVIQEVWDRVKDKNRRISLNAKVGRTARALKVWNKEVFGWCQSKMRELKDKLVFIRSLNPYEEVTRIK